VRVYSSPAVVAVVAPVSRRRAWLVQSWLPGWSVRAAALPPCGVYIPHGLVHWLTSSKEENRLPRVNLRLNPSPTRRPPRKCQKPASGLPTPAFACQR